MTSRRALHGLTAAFIAATAGLPLTGVAQAHDARPLSVGIVEQAPDVYRVVVRAPPTLDASNVPRIVFPEDCDLRESAPLALQPGATSLVVCRQTLAGRAISVEYPVYNPALTTLFRIERRGLAPSVAALPPDELTWTVPAEPSRYVVAWDYTLLGFEHIWSGPDHLLFVAGLMLLAKRPRRILIAVTGFTAAHSLTLALAALGVVHVPIPPVEAMIALSILFLATEIARSDAQSFSRRYPLALSFSFGLLHGFGFASALGEVGLPTNEVATGLLFFNAGVELGQLAFIGAAAVALIAWSRLRAAGVSLRPRRLEARASLAGAYVLGIPAAFWFCERTAAAFVG